MSERSEWVRYQVEHKKRNFISTSSHVLFYLLYKHINLRLFFMIFWIFLNSFWRFLKILWKLCEGRIFQIISENFWRLPKISKDNQRFLRKNRWCFDHTATHLSTLRDYVTIAQHKSSPGISLVFIEYYYSPFIHCTNSNFLSGWFVPHDTGLWQNNHLNVIFVV